MKYVKSIKRYHSNVDYIKKHPHCYSKIDIPWQKFQLIINLVSEALTR